MNDETYNGWKNQETWNMNLWLTNDEYLNNHLMPELVVHATSAIDAGNRIETWWDDEAQEILGELYEQIRSDVGSIWRVDWTEIGAAFREEP